MVDNAHRAWGRKAVTSVPRPRAFRVKGRALQALLLRKLEAAPAPRDIRRAAISIVNRTLEASGATVEVRQSVNDACDEYAESVIRELLGAEDEAPQESAAIANMIHRLEDLVGAMPRRRYRLRRIAGEESHD
jgi:hypothetical protein